jgi:hypothetical protein
VSIPAPSKENLARRGQTSTQLQRECEQGLREIERSR